MAAGADATKYLWRPLEKNNAVFDFAYPPRTLGQITVAETHPSSIEALVKAVRALKAWSAAFDVENKDKDVLLLYLLTPSRFSTFGFQRYRQPGKVSQRAVAGVVQCKVAVPVKGAPYAAVNLKPSNMVEQLDLNANLADWETALDCKPDPAAWKETELVSGLAAERDGLMSRGCVYDSDEQLLHMDFGALGYPSLQAHCKHLGLPACGPLLTLVSRLNEYVKMKIAEKELGDMEE